VGNGERRQHPALERLRSQPDTNDHVVHGSSLISQGRIHDAHNFQEEGGVGASLPTSPATVIDNIPAQDPALKMAQVKGRSSDVTTPRLTEKQALLFCRVGAMNMTDSEKLLLHAPTEKLPEQSNRLLADGIGIPTEDSVIGPSHMEARATHSADGPPNTVTRKKASWMSLLA
jgi:hypothetical protein